ncbi:extracellular solute-binding protein [Streptomyces sp. PSKA28]|uniref:Extracellular solute-binding protein n=1 Tax=Streptomyces himalayensis subsp. himalayensis TaxID=2756131 RepID=A0A7W0DM77_9ACTN|nr:extracellular solute-binding protein [Streptomyces himalayensis]MBA2947218.1 extracellular solute-binding protein [Streptomyces himalayensis subsp. himalayensis]
MTASLAACGASEGSSNVTLTLVAADYGDSAANSSEKYWDKLVKAFEAKNPDIKVKVSVYSWNDVDRKVKEMVAEGKAPDMAQIGAYADYAADGKLYSADDLLSIPVQADFLPQLSEAGEVDRVQYGMPFAASTRLLFYNKTLFKEAGITPPKSWADLQAAARVLKSRGVKIPYALPLGPEEAQAETMMWLLSGGAGYTDNVGTYDLDSSENIRTFDWLRDDLVGEDLTGPTPPGKLNRAHAFAAFTRGDVGMLNGHPTLMQMAAKKGVKFGMVPMPGPNGPSKATIGVADWMMAFKQNGRGEQIGTFLDYVYSEKNVLAFSHEYDLLPVTTSASYAMSDDKDDRQLAGFLEELPNSELYPVGKTSWAQVSAAIKQQIGKAVTKNGKPASILGQIQREAASAENAE